MTIYSRFGVRTVVNARGNATLAGGTLMAPEVVDAMSEAAGSFALIADLQDAASEVIAEVTGAEAGYVTTGAAAALTLGAAAILARLDPDRMEALPDTGGGPSEFVVQRVAPKRLRPPRPRVRRTARRVRRRERRDGRRDGGLHRRGDGRRVLPGPSRGTRPADRRVRDDGPRPRPAGPRRCLDEPAPARRPAPVHRCRRRPRRVQRRQDHRRAPGVGLPGRSSRPAGLGRPPAAGHGRHAGHLDPSLAPRDRESWRGRRRTGSGAR